MVIQEDLKSVKVTNKTKRRLDVLGKKNDTYNDIIEHLLNFYDSNVSDLDKTLNLLENELFKNK